ncbi:MAG TPA: hypothetical protein VN032_07070 [Thermoanaerobaculia bacterium]|jgi:hypothetical protein|nr:hypothetical protein [Thermoanaerobaculia bacterium]
MGAPTRRPADTVYRFLALAVLAGHAAAAAGTETTDSLPAAGQPTLTISFFVDRKLGAGMQESLDEAARRLSDSRCQALLTDFADGSGRRLDENLHAIGQSMPAYLGLVLFYDGSATEPCANERVLAWTSPGSRAVHVCWSQFSHWQRASPGYTANIVIHEALHTLGLGEGPPTSRQITAKVIERCGN